VSKVLVVLKV